MSLSETAPTCLISHAAQSTFNFYACALQGPATNMLSFLSTSINSHSVVNLNLR
ncbi:hypothetical protein K239x_16020 [Planctomycetes bacterium K23_9]|uniref:Uncharacterized protein n=1 Tax=Stieleria marina TaxID=1930275 RepID=A0A517NRA8_9BACT|nr:hypothetical protein K239x_16020 [Planctomycetes bacterium K23_9]